MLDLERSEDDFSGKSDSAWSFTSSSAVSGQVTFCSVVGRLLTADYEVFTLYYEEVKCFLFPLSPKEILNFGAHRVRNVTPSF